MSHEKVYVVCENMCMEEGMTKAEVNNLLNNKVEKSTLIREDLNTKKDQTAFYYCDECANRPFNINGYFFVQKLNDDYIKQEYTTVLNEKYIRTCLDGTWGDWQKVILQGDFAVITGSVECEANNSEDAQSGVCKFTNVDVDYPEGFTNENCVVVSIGSANPTNEYYSYYNGGVSTSIDIIWGTIPLKVALRADKMKVGAGNLSTEAKTRDYKIVLMKVS